MIDNSANSSAPSARLPRYCHPVMRPHGTRPDRVAGEKRRAPRHKIAIPALLEFDDSEILPITVTDISLAGFACDSDRLYPLETRCWLKLPAMPLMPHFSLMEAQVVRCAGPVMGCAFSYMLHPAELDPYIAEYKIAAWKRVSD